MSEAIATIDEAAGRSRLTSNRRWVAGGVARAISTALETVRRQDAEGRFPSSERKAGCRERASGEMARATPTHRRGCLD